MRASPIGLLAAAILASPAGTAPAQPRGTLVASPRVVPAAGPVLAGNGGIAWVSRDGRDLDEGEVGNEGAPRLAGRRDGSGENGARVVGAG